ncbi:MAG: coenzyme F420-0:L-glutamate ligase, partial [Acidimicrobiales bacterium]
MKRPPPRPISLIPVVGLPEVRPGDSLAALIAEHGEVASGDVVVVTQKVVSKAEGRLVAVDPDDPTSHKALVRAEAVRVLRRRGDLVVTETRHGFVCANA